MLKLVEGLAFRTSKFYIAPYSKINCRLVNLSYNCDVKLGLKFASHTVCLSFFFFFFFTPEFHAINSKGHCSGSNSPYTII